MQTRTMPHTILTDASIAHLMRTADYNVDQLIDRKLVICRTCGEFHPITGQLPVEPQQCPACECCDAVPLELVIRNSRLPNWVTEPIDRMDVSGEVQSLQGLDIDSLL